MLDNIFYIFILKLCFIKILFIMNNSKVSGLPETTTLILDISSVDSALLEVLAFVSDKVSQIRYRDIPNSPSMDTIVPGSELVSYVHYLKWVNPVKSNLIYNTLLKLLQHRLLLAIELWYSTKWTPEHILKWIIIRWLDYWLSEEQVKALWSEIDKKAVKLWECIN